MDSSFGGEESRVGAESMHSGSQSNQEGIEQEEEIEVALHSKAEDVRSRPIEQKLTL